MANDTTSGKAKKKSDFSLGAVDIELEINFELIERRRSVRAIPCPEAVERNDEESWSTWHDLMAEPPKQDAKAAMAKLKRLLRRRPHSGDPA
jgi:hypothetical protein